MASKNCNNTAKSWPDRIFWELNLLWISPALNKPESGEESRTPATIKGAAWRKTHMLEIYHLYTILHWQAPHASLLWKKLPYTTWPGSQAGWDQLNAGGFLPPEQEQGAQNSSSWYRPGYLGCSHQRTSMPFRDLISFTRSLMYSRSPHPVKICENIYLLHLESWLKAGLPPCSLHTTTFSPFQYSAFFVERDWFWEKYIVPFPVRIEIGLCFVSIRSELNQVCKWYQCSEWCRMDSVQPLRMALGMPVSCVYRCFFVLVLSEAGRQDVQFKSDDQDIQPTGSSSCSVKPTNSLSKSLESSAVQPSCEYLSLFPLWNNAVSSMYLLSSSRLST